MVLRAISTSDSVEVNQANFIEYIEIVEIEFVEDQFE